MQGFEAVKHELDEKRHQLEQELAAVRGRASELEADLERVHEALGALAGTKKKTKARSRSKKAAPTVQDLQQHIADVREGNPFADAGALEEGVRTLVKASGLSLSGFRALFAEALLTSPGTGSTHPVSAHGGHGQGFALGHPGDAQGA